MYEVCRGCHIPECCVGPSVCECLHLFKMFKHVPFVHKVNLKLLYKWLYMQVAFDVNILIIYIMYFFQKYVRI